MDALVFEKKLGYHRDAPRLYFQTLDLNPYGFTPGARYDAELFADNHIELRLHEKGRRAVCKKNVGGRTLSIIDLNGKALMFPFTGDKRVLVSTTPGLVTIVPIKEEYDS